MGGPGYRCQKQLRRLTIRLKVSSVSVVRVAVTEKTASASDSCRRGAEIEHSDKGGRTQVQERRTPRNLEDIGAYVKHEVFQRAPKKNAINIIDGTWVLKWKWKSSTTRHCSARLCLRGFKDSQKAELDAFHRSKDDTTHHLFGQKYGDQGRVIHLKVDAEITALLRELPGFEDFGHNTEVLKLLKSAYGLVDAPELWFESLTLTLKEANWKATLLDPAL
eukprot:4989869-Amphidinium_carterae.1